MECASPDAVRRSLGILARHYSLFGSERVRGWGISMAEPDVSRVTDAFEAAGAAWVLVGAHAVGLLTEPRATVDFDFIVDGRKLQDVLARLREAFGDLGEVDIGAAVRLVAIDVDLIRSTNHPLFAEALRLAEPVGVWRVPPPELVVVLKFLSAVSPWRNVDKRHHDIGDLGRVYRATAPDRAAMLQLAALVYPGAEDELDALLTRMDEGLPITI